MSQEQKIIDKTVAELVKKLIKERKADFDLVSPSQVCGFLDVNPATLRTLPIKRYVIIPNKVVKYKLSEVLAYLETIKE